MQILDQVREALRTRHYSLRTEDAYLYWVRRFLFFHGGRNPARFEASHISAFLNYLVNTEQVDPATRNQALEGVLFFFRHILHTTFPADMEFIPVKPHKPLPTVLSQAEVQRLFQQLKGLHWVMAALLYGSGLRLAECVRLRVRDLDLEAGVIRIRNDDGSLDRVVTLDESLIPHLRLHLARVRQLHVQDLALGGGSAPVSPAVERKRPHAGREWAWQFAFPASQHSHDTVTPGSNRRHYAESVLQKALQDAVSAAYIDKPASSETLRHSFAAHLLEQGHDMRTVKAQLGHRDLQQDGTSARAQECSAQAVKSPFSQAVSTRPLGYGHQTRLEFPFSVREPAGQYLLAG